MTNDKNIEMLRSRIERLETALEIAGIDLPEKVAESVLSSPDKWEKMGRQSIFDRWEQGGIKSKLANLIIAPENCNFVDLSINVGTEIDGNVYYTFTEAMELEEKVLLPNGWRLPTRSEWALLVEEFGQNEEGELDVGRLTERLTLPFTGYFGGGSFRNGDTYGNYWSRTSHSDTNAYYLSFDASNIYPQDYNDKQYGFAVRAVKGTK